MSRIQNQHDLRYIQNPFNRVFSIIKPDFDKTYSMLYNLIEDFFNHVKIPCLLSISSEQKQTEVSIDAYDGSSGYTYTLIRLAKFFGEREKHKVSKASQIFQGDDIKKNKWTDSQFYLHQALQQHKAVSKFILQNRRSNSKFSFYMSEVCQWVCGMHIGYMTRDHSLFRQCQGRMIQCFHNLKENLKKVQWQVLYGVPGFLYALLQLQAHYDNLGEQLFKTNFWKLSVEITHIIIQHGIKSYQLVSKREVNLHAIISQFPADFRLFYTFHDKQYLGGAHGLGGNLNIILLSIQMNIGHFGKNQFNIFHKVITKSVQHILKHLINGNFGTSTGSQKVKLVHFCHGCPGIVHCLARYCQLFPEDGIKMGLKQVVQANLQHIWKYGVLKKGFGLCHGISGNAYAFIAPIVQRLLPQKMEQYQKKAALMAILRQQKQVMKQINEFNFPDRFKIGVSDNPYSLMLGVAGDICFILDVIMGVGKFPGFDF